VTDESEERASEHIVLRLRAHDKLIGRLIGKGGATIRGIIDESGASWWLRRSTRVQAAPCRCRARRSTATDPIER